MKSRVIAEIAAAMLPDMTTKKPTRPARRSNDALADELDSPAFTQMLLDDPRGARWMRLVSEVSAALREPEITARSSEITDAYTRDVVEPNREVYGADVEAARDVLKRYRKGQWHINGAIVREALDAAYSANDAARRAAFEPLLGYDALVGAIHFELSKDGLLGLLDANEYGLAKVQDWRGLLGIAREAADAIEALVKENATLRTTCETFAMAAEIAEKHHVTSFRIAAAGLFLADGDSHRQLQALLEQRKRVLALFDAVEAETKCPARECTCYLGTINTLLGAIRAALEEPCK